MISTPGPLELLFLLGLALLVLGPSRLPEAARSAGKAVRELREALSSDRDEPDEEHADEFAAADDDVLPDDAEAEAHGDPIVPRPTAGTEAGDPAPPPVS